MIQAEIKENIKRINVLPKNIAELIAAGEVIERPSSVIKEVVENSIDSGATDITIEIIRGGISYIRVTDNGCGITPEDMPLAFLRHSTSKVTSEKDLYDIKTMGFRGEALASICAVAKVELMSKRREDEIGSVYKIAGSEETEFEKCGCPDGTTIIIRDLFFNTPARLKFLKKDVSEGNSVQAVVDKLAMIHPEVAFRFIRDNKPVRITSGDGKLYSAIYSILGKDLAASLIPVEYSYNGINVNGFISSPLFARGNRTQQYFYVNGRYIKSTSCMAALEEGYRGNLMVGKFPACVLNIELSYSDVDVNVHPAKTEVRFTNDKLIFDCIYFAVKNAILCADNEKPVSVPKKEFIIESAPQTETEQIKLQEPEKLILHSPKLEFERVRKDPEYSTRETFEEIGDIETKVEEKFKFINKNAFMKSPKIDEDILTLDEPEPINFIYIGEIFKTYIVCEQAGEMLLIDKHAADERIRYNKLKKELISTTQLLFESVFVSFETEYKDALLDNRELLSSIGIEIMQSDRNSYEVEITSVPSMLINENISEIMGEIAEKCIHGSKNIDFIFDEILHSIACRSAVKANMLSSDDELKALAQNVLSDKSVRFCPHGRPIVVTIKKSEIEKYFGRI